MYLDIFARVLFQPVRYLDRTDVAALPVVSAALADKHFIAVLEPVDSDSSLDCGIKKALVPRHKDRKRGEHYIVRSLPVCTRECLAVGNDQLWLFAKRRDSIRKLGILDDYRAGICVEDIPYRLLLRKYKPALWRTLVDRHNKHNKVISLQLVAYKAHITRGQLCKRT